MFAVYDRDKDGSISREEMAEAMVEAGMLDETTGAGRRGGRFTFTQPAAHKTRIEHKAALSRAMDIVGDTFDRHSKGKKELNYQDFLEMMGARARREDPQAPGESAWER